MIVKGKGNPDYNHKRITIEPYAMVYTGTTNDTKRRSVPSIAIKKSDNHGGRYFMSLCTGKLLHSYQWTKLTIYDEIIAQVIDLAEVEDAKKLTDNYPMFEWAPGVLITEYVSEEYTPIREET